MNRALLVSSFVLLLPCAQVAAQGVTFVDVTAASGVYGEYFMPGEEIPGGGAVADFNNDGFQDIFLIGGWTGDKLFINAGNGTFVESAAAWGVNVAHFGIGIAVGDYNNDGWLDAYVTSLGIGVALGSHRLYHNVGGTHFVEVAATAGVHATSTVVPDGWGAAFGDYDLDGDLDLFVGAWYPSDGNRLFRNEGNGTFLDVTVTAMGVVNSRTFSPRFVDMDGDFYPELLLAADFATSRYYRNTGFGSFIDSTLSSGTGIDANGMGQTVADYNGDGLLDWYVTSVHSEVSQGPTVPGTGNMLYLQEAAHLYVESSLPSGVNDGGWGWGVLSVDFDHDGAVDLIETNGWPDVIFTNESSYAFRNDGTGHFADVSANTGIAAHSLQGRGIAGFDYDNDGDQDVIIFGNNDPVRLYRCDHTGPDKHWLRIFLDTTGTTLAPNGFGSRVRVTTGNLEQLRSLDGGCNYLSQSELSAHFGLGAATYADVRVEWSNGVVSLYDETLANQTLTIAPGLFTYLRGDCDSDGLFNIADVVVSLQQVFGGGGTVPCERACDANGDGQLDVSDPVAKLHALFLSSPASSTLGGCYYGDTPAALTCASATLCP
ncbi:MAG: FG-GAP-like repeat-containing protein [Planctomycetota bacterium]